ncbi:hypothetical protein GQ457_02G023180 [Hibiscus cannabinus]
MEHVRGVDEEAMLKPPKELSPYMNFYVTQCKGVKLEGGKRKMDNNVRKALGLRWAKMLAEEKKRYIEMSEEQKQAEAEWILKCELEEVVKKEEEKLSRCSLKKLSNIFKDMQKVKIENVVKELGFSPLIGISLRAIHRDLCRELAEKFDVECSMMEYSGHKIPVMVEDVQDVLGLKNEGRDVEEATRKYDGKELAKKHKINANATYEQLEWEILCGAFEGDELKARVLLYVVGVFLCPNANRVPSVEHFKLLCSAGLCRKLNWCKYAYERLIDGIAKLQKKWKEGGRTNGGDDVIMEMLGKVIAEFGEIKESLEARVKKDNKIENNLETLKEESKKVIDAKFSIGLEEGETMMEKTDVEQSNREYEANIFYGALKEDVILLKGDNVGLWGKKKG